MLCAISYSFLPPITTMIGDELTDNNNNIQSLAMR